MTTASAENEDCENGCATATPTIGFDVILRVDGSDRMAKHGDCEVIADGSTSCDRSETFTLIRLSSLSRQRGARKSDGANPSNACAQDEESALAQLWLGQGSGILNQQWPRGGPIAVYRDKLLSPPLPSTATASEQGGGTHGPSSSHSDTGSNSMHAEPLHCCDAQYALPCSYLMIRNGEECIGHGRLTDCFEGAGGNAAAVTYLMIHPENRKSGYGRMLMRMLEAEAVRLGYHYIYLWTQTAIGFYERLGYQHTHRVSLYRACLKSLDVTQISSLEGMLLRMQSKNGKSASAAASAKAETITLLPDDAPDQSASQEAAPVEDVWLKKRLVERVGAQSIPLIQRKDQLTKYLQNYPSEKETTVADKPPVIPASFKVWLNSVPWQQQIGPSCGLAALRMVRDYLHERSPSTQDDSKAGATTTTTPTAMPSLLDAAQSRGFSSDGEIFDMNNLRTLAEEICGIDCEMKAITKLDETDTQSSALAVAADMLRTLQQDGLVILPYDSNSRTRAPCNLHGFGAHYGIVVGMILRERNKGTVEIESDGVNDEASKCALVIEDENDMAPFKALTAQDLLPASHTKADCIRDDNGAPCIQTNIHLLVQHSLSQQFSIAPLGTFLDSNAQLNEVDSCKFSGVKRLDLRNRYMHCRGIIQ